MNALMTKVTNIINFVDQWSSPLPFRPRSKPSLLPAPQLRNDSSLCTFTVHKKWTKMFAYAVEVIKIFNLFLALHRIIEILKQMKVAHN